ncbi:DUF6776 family protein [Methylophaga sp.]|uniref:DUF6776 family protein n=1 Tax=Methylophaga sp. TaxID=2024840 RepID=UPI003F6A07F0
MLDRPYVIHYRRPYRCLLIVLLAFALAGGGTWYWSQQWRLQQIEKLTALQSQHKQLLTENQRLTERNQSLMMELEGNNQLQAMRQATDSQLESELETLQEKLIQLNKELSFYQNITQGTVSSELQIRELHLRSNDENQTLFQYRIVLTQGKKITKALRGKVVLKLTYSTGEETQSRLLNEHALNIRHVQVLEGTVTLTENEVPVSLQVALTQGEKTLTERTFEWDATLSP